MDARASGAYVSPDAVELVVPSLDELEPADELEPTFVDPPGVSAPVNPPVVSADTGDASFTGDAASTGVPPASHPQQSQAGFNMGVRSGVGGGGRDYHGGHPGGGRGVGHGVGRGRGPPPAYAPPQRPDNGGGNGSNLPQPRLPRPFNDFPYGYLPAYLPGAASMVEQLDRRLLVILRDGRHLVGILRTFDQFSNMVLQETSERRILVVAGGEEQAEDGAYAGGGNGGAVCYQTDIELGLFVIRGDSVVLFGEVEDDEEGRSDGPVRFVSLEEFERLEEVEARRKGEGEERWEEPVNWDFDMDLVA